MITPGRNSETVSFNEDKLKKVTPPLGEPSGNENLSKEELKKIFGIREDHFSKIPKQFVLPLLEAEWRGEGYHPGGKWLYDASLVSSPLDDLTSDSWHKVSGYIHVVEPLEWVPAVSRGRVWPVSELKQHFEETETHESTSTFTKGCEASVSFGASGSYYGITAEAKTSADIKVQETTDDKVTRVLKGEMDLGEKTICELSVFPNLKCKILRSQWVEYRVDNYRKKLVWSKLQSRDQQKFFDTTAVNHRRVQAIAQKCAQHPVRTIKGEVSNDPVHLLTVPQLNGDKLEITTLLKLDGWTDWHIYNEEPWKEDTRSGPVLLAVPGEGAPFPFTRTFAAYDN